MRVMLQRMWRCVLVIIGSLLLFACQTIEHRSEVMTKEPLAKLLLPKIKPQLLWSNTASYGVGKSGAKLRLAVTDSMVVVADYKGQLLTLHRGTGRLHWRQSTKLNITAGPGVGEGRIVVGDKGGEISAYRMADGGFLWRANLGGSVLAAPLVSDKAVFAHVLDGSVIALNTENGQQLWRYSVNTPPVILRQSSRPLLVGNHLMVGFANGKLKALDRLSGTVDWEQEIAISKGRSDVQRMVDISADPVVRDNLVYVVSYQGKLAALEVETGAIRWDRELSSYSGLTVSNQAVFVSDAKGIVWALNRQNGEVLWKCSALSGRRLSAPALIQNNIVVGDEDGYLHWISQNDGSLVGRVLVDSKGVEATPIIKDNVVYVLGRSGKVAAYIAKDTSS